MCARQSPPSPAADGLNVNASMLVGGQIAGGKLGLYLIYGQGNFIACGLTPRISKSAS